MSKEIKRSYKQIISTLKTLRTKESTRLFAALSLNGDICIVTSEIIGGLKIEEPLLKIKISDEKDSSKVSLLLNQYFSQTSNNEVFTLMAPVWEIK
jgi:hypothetical protein